MREREHESKEKFSSLPSNSHTHTREKKVYKTLLLMYVEFRLNVQTLRYFMASLAVSSSAALLSLPISLTDLLTYITLFHFFTLIARMW
jgi:hypothetical protein